MANKENCPPTPPSASSIAVGLRPWHTTAFTSPPLRAISPNSKPVLNRQRDHSACGRPETPLKVRKTRENLRANAGYPDIPPPCVCGTDNDTSITSIASAAYVSPALHYPQQGNSLTSTEPSTPALRPLLKTERHKSVSQRMLSKVKQGINNRSKASLSVHTIETEPSLIQRLSSRRKHSHENERRAQSFEICRDSVGSIDEYDYEALSVEAVMARRSLSESTLSTSELMIDCPSTPTQHDFEAAWTQTPQAVDLSSPVHGCIDSCEQTPRPLSNKPVKSVPTRLLIPAVSLTVTLEQTTVDCNLRADVWVAIEACVQAFAEHSPSGGSGVNSTIRHNDLDASEQVAGRISSMRICYKPVQGCTVLEVIGHKSMKDLTIGQKCSLFVRVRVHEVPHNLLADHDEQNSLFTELESLVGTLTTELLHVEVRYRTTLLPYDNVVTVKHVAKVTRPQTDSRWSIIGTYNDIEMSEQTHTKLAIYIADTYSAERALRYLDRHLSNELMREVPLQQIRRTIAAELGSPGLDCIDAVDRRCPTVVVTPDEPSKNERPDTASSSRSRELGRSETYSQTNNSRTVSTSVMPPPLLAASPPLQTLQSVMLMTATDMQTNDDARRVWHHIRRSSQSTNQLSSKAEEQIEDLEAGDDRLKTLRDKALANKRSVGAETLKGWKWDGEMMRLGEAPWL